MHIAFLAPLVESVPPRSYGGTERVVHWLTEEMIRRGHQVTLFATGDSLTRARLVPGAPRNLRASSPDERVALTLSMVGAALARAREFDVVHAHVDWLAFPFGRLVPTPIVHTLHGRLDLPHLPALFARHPELELVSISDAQRAPLRGVRFLATVRHGMPLDLLTPVPARREDYVVFLGRFSPEKGPLLAIAAARAAGVRLLLAAKIDPNERAYFEAEVRPRLERGWGEYVGEVDDAEKRQLLGRARALLAPIDWPEPFGLVFIEALATGTPIVTRPCGSAPEIVEHGRTGWFARTVPELAAAIRAAGRIDPRACRAAFEQRFSVERMGREYEALYRDLVERRRRAARVQVRA